MNEKDDKIQSILNEAANENLPDPDKILGKAREQMRKQKPERKSVFTARRVLTFATAIAAVVMVVIIGASVYNRFFLPSDGNTGSSVVTPAPPQDNSPSKPNYNVTYSADKLTVRSVSYADAKAAFESKSEGVDFPVPNQIDDGVTLANLSLYMYRNRETGEDVLIECVMRLSSSRYGNDELTLYFELTDETYEQNAAYLSLPRYNGYAMAGARENGEYVSWAYVENKYRCMMRVMNGNEYRAEYYLGLLFGL